MKDMSRERHLQVLADRAGERWARRVHARIAARWDPSVEQRLRDLEVEAQTLFTHLSAMAPADPLIADVRRAKPERDQDSEWEDEEDLSDG
jgi:hypothetical protein